MIRRALGCVVACGCLMAGVSHQAHHSLAGVYDMKSEKEIVGTLTAIKFVNPHGSMTITVKNADGTTTDWTFTTGSATTLARQGSARRRQAPVDAGTSRRSWAQIAANST